MTYHRLMTLGKQFIINSKLGRLDMDIASLQETRLAAEGMLWEKDYTFY